jgi:hypothetical protein
MKLMPSTEQSDHYAKMHASTTGESYLESLRFVEDFFATGGEPVHLVGATQASLDLHHRVRALIMAEKEKGNTITYLEAVSRIEKEQAKS